MRDSNSSSTLAWGALICLHLWLALCAAVVCTVPTQSVFLHEGSACAQRGEVHLDASQRPMHTTISPSTMPPAPGSLMHGDC